MAAAEGDFHQQLGGLGCRPVANDPAEERGLDVGRKLTGMAPEQRDSLGGLRLAEIAFLCGDLGQDVPCAGR
jgi:hypothetical protein